MLVEIPPAEARYAQKLRTHSGSGITVCDHFKGEVTSIRQVNIHTTHESFKYNQLRTHARTAAPDDLARAPGHLQRLRERQWQHCLQERVQVRWGEWRDVGGPHQHVILEEGGHLGEELLALQDCGRRMHTCVC